jgi:hypothetical protein
MIPLSFGLNGHHEKGENRLLSISTNVKLISTLTRIKNHSYSFILTPKLFIILITTRGKFFEAKGKSKPASHRTHFSLF